MHGSVSQEGHYILLHKAGVSNWRYGAKHSANENLLAPSTVYIMGARLSIP